jgi:hypothetical protein
MAEGLGRETRAGEAARCEQGRPLRPSGPGQREDATLPGGGAGETAPSCRVEQHVPRRVPSYEKPTPSRSPRPQRPEGPTLRREKRTAVDADSQAMKGQAGGNGRAVASSCGAVRFGTERTPLGAPYLGGFEVNVLLNTGSRLNGRSGCKPLGEKDLRALSAVGPEWEVALSAQLFSCFGWAASFCRAVRSRTERTTWGGVRGGFLR